MNKSSGAKANKAPMKKVAKKQPKKVVQKRKLSTKVLKKQPSLLTTQKRHGSVAVDHQDRLLPVNYHNHHLHDPYDPFYVDTSTVFDEHAQEDHYLRVLKPGDFEQMTSNQIDALFAQIPTVRKSITCPTELDMFNKTVGHALELNDAIDIKSEAEISYEMEKLGFNHIRNVEFVHKSFGEFFMNDFRYGSAKDKMLAIGVHSVMWGCAAYLSYIGVSAIDQYFYDLQYPPVSHDHH